MALCELPELLRRADVVTLHAPAVFGGPSLLGAGEIRLLRPRSVVVNTSRARLVNEGEIVRAVEDGRVAGYALDDRLVDRERAARLLREGRIVETGHTAWYSQEALDRGLDCWVRNVTELAAACRTRPARPLVGSPA